MGVVDGRCSVEVEDEETGRSRGEFVSSLSMGEDTIVSNEELIMPVLLVWSNHDAKSLCCFSLLVLIVENLSLE